MSAIRPQLSDTARALLGGGAPIDAWRDAGFGGLLTPEADGGIGGDWDDACAMLRLVGYERPDLPVAALILEGAAGDPLLEGALSTVALIGGALQKLLEMSIDYANTRVQFGKPIAKQQALQQSLAILAEEAAIAAVVAQSAAEAHDRAPAPFEIACAKIRANRAAAQGVAIAHQTHGAIGFTQEFALQGYTRKLSEWRSEYGGTAFWTARVGETACAAPGSALWPMLTALSD